MHAALPVQSAEMHGGTKGSLRCKWSSHAERTMSKKLGHVTSDACSEYSHELGWLAALINARADPSTSLVPFAAHVMMVLNLALEPLSWISATFATTSWPTCKRTHMYHGFELYIHQFEKAVLLVGNACQVQLTVAGLRNESVCPR